MLAFCLPICLLDAWFLRGRPPHVTNSGDLKNNNKNKSQTHEAKTGSYCHQRSACGSWGGEGHRLPKDPVKPWAVEFEILAVCPGVSHLTPLSLVV